MAKTRGGLTKWFKEDWVDISAPKKGGGFKKCGRSKAKGSKRGYPKCVSKAKANKMTKSRSNASFLCLFWGQVFFLPLPFFLLTMVATFLDGLALFLFTADFICDLVILLALAFETHLG